MDAFVAAPERYLRSVLEVAKGAPELIHMLRLQEHFPAASIQEIMRQGAQAGRTPPAMAPSLLPCF